MALSSAGVGTVEMQGPAFEKSSSSYSKCKTCARHDRCGWSCVQYKIHSRKADFLFYFKMLTPSLNGKTRPVLAEFLSAIAGGGESQLYRKRQYFYYLGDRGPSQSLLYVT